MLDTKLKDSKGKYIINIVVLLLLVASSVGMYSAYPAIKEGSKKYEYNVFDRNGEFLMDLGNSNCGIYFDILKRKENRNVEPADIILNTNKKYDDYVYRDLRYKKEFDDQIYRYKKNLDGHLKNLEYYAIAKDSKLIDERNQGDIKELLDDNINIDFLEQNLKKKYNFYIVIDYDDQGKSTIKKLYGADKANVLEQLRNDEITHVGPVEMKPIKNMTYVYAVPKELKYRDLIAAYKESNEINAYETAAIFFMTIVSIFIILASLAIPYNISKQLIGFEKVAKIPIEIIALIIFIISAFLCEAPKLIAKNLINEGIVKLSPINLSMPAINGIVDIVNILYWFLCFGAIFIVIVIIKHIFKTGIKEYIKKNFLIYIVLRSIWRLIRRCNKRFYSYLVNIDLKEKNKKKIAVLLGINLVVVSIMNCLWIFGIIAAIIYTIVLFWVITKHYNNISDRYNKLLEATNKIAEGNLDVTIEEELGVFNAFKEEIKSIQKGFKRAVGEEVKSQKMKTELISNVSHDLKTPLTSIITYVDLLKNENISEEKRREYLDTLDRKSQRLQELIEDLFEMSKATSGNIHLNIVEVDVVALMKQTLLELDDKISKASLIIKTSYPDSKILVLLDSQRIFRVFENLIINITKYAMKGSRVYIDINSEEDKVEIILKNMAADEINFSVDDIVERFVRGDKARNTEGSGLGLAIAKSFVELQGGELNVNVDGDLFKVTITFQREIM